MFYLRVLEYEYNIFHVSIMNGETRVRWVKKKDGTRCLQYARRGEATCARHSQQSSVFHDLAEYRERQANAKTLTCLKIVNALACCIL